MRTELLISTHLEWIHKCLNDYKCLYANDLIESKLFSHFKDNIWNIVDYWSSM